MPVILIYTPPRNGIRPVNPASHVIPAMFHGVSSDYASFFYWLVIKGVTAEHEKGDTKVIQE